jgi:hypothetical protein
VLPLGAAVHIQFDRFSVLAGIRLTLPLRLIQQFGRGPDPCDFYLACVLVSRGRRRLLSVALTRVA